MQVPSIVALYRDVGAPPVPHLSCEDQFVQQSCVLFSLPLSLVFPIFYIFFLFFLSPFDFVFFSACCQYLPEDSGKGVPVTCHIHGLLHTRTVGGMLLFTCAGLYNYCRNSDSKSWHKGKVPLSLGPYATLLYYMFLKCLVYYLDVHFNHGICVELCLLECTGAE